MAHMFTDLCPELKSESKLGKHHEFKHFLYSTIFLTLTLYCLSPNIGV